MARDEHEQTPLPRDTDFGSGKSADELVPLVYDALRRLAASRLGREAAPDTLQATALVHDAYPPVTERMLAGSKTSHRTGVQEYDFVWTFNGNRFRIEGANLPADLLSALTGAQSSSSSIEGTWRISGENIILTNRATGSETSMRVFSSAPSLIRIESPAAQYVFSTIE